METWACHQCGLYQQPGGVKELFAHGKTKDHKKGVIRFLKRRIAGSVRCQKEDARSIRKLTKELQK